MADTVRTVDFLPEIFQTPVNQQFLAATLDQLVQEPAFKKTQGLDSVSYNIGERGAQILILPYPQIKMTEVDNLSDTERGDGGFGSTGK